MRSLLLGIGLLFALKTSWADIPAACQFSLQELVSRTNLAQVSPELGRMIDSGFIERLSKSQPEEFIKISRLTEMIGKDDSLEFRLDSKSFNAGWSVHKKDGTLEVTIEYFISKTGPTNKTASKKELKFGETPKALNLTFARFLIAIFNGVQNTLSHDPSLQKIQVVGQTVVNRSLARQLQKLGFQQNPDSTLDHVKDVTKTNREIMPATFTNILVQAFSALTVLSQPTDANAKLIVSIKSGQVAAGAGIAAYKGWRMSQKPLLGRDWTLTVDVEPQQAKPKP